MFMGILEVEFCLDAGLLSLAAGGEAVLYK